MAGNIIVPDFPYTGHYYPEILEDLVQRHRQEVPELTDEDPAEPHQQLLRTIALSTHYNNVILDLVANEMYLPTANLRSSVANLLALIDVRMAQASPASVDVLFKLNRTFPADVLIVPSGSVFATEDVRSSSGVPFEVLSDLSTIRTDIVGYVYSYAGSIDSWVDCTAAAQSPEGDEFTSWNDSNEILYIGHPDVLWDRVDINLASAASNLLFAWEYYDGGWEQGPPTSITNTGTFLRARIDSILGPSKRAGAVVRIRSLITGAFADLGSYWDPDSGGNWIDTAGFLGQPTPSIRTTDYVVGAQWRELKLTSDGSTGLTVPGFSTITYDLPQTLLSDWRKTTVGGGGVAANAYWLRIRIVDTPDAPGIPQISQIQIHRGGTYMVAPATQGLSREDNPLGSSTGLPGQEFTFGRFPVIDDSNLTAVVEEAPGVLQDYAKVDNFLNSTSADRHFVANFDDDGSCTISFGDGNNGRIPPAGSNNIRSTYRTLDDVNGNVGAETVTLNRSGIAYISSIRNPRPAIGYAQREGATAESLAKLKISGPATLRTRNRAVSPDDVEVLSVSFVSSDGSKPFARALAIEEAFGLKTIQSVVVGNGGIPVISTLLTELEEHFNGNATNRGLIVMNHQVTATNFTPNAIDVTVTVFGGSLAAITTALTALLHPLSTRDDGDYAWKFGSKIFVARILQEIMNTKPGPRNAVIDTPSADIQLNARELPVVGTLVITVNP